MRKIITLFVIVLWSLFTFSQTTIKMEKQISGIYKIPCKINGLELNFIFDTGASNVVISETEARFMLKNNYLQSDDIIGTSYAQVASGDIIKNKSIILREIDIEGLKLYNIKALIVQNDNAPLLLGQSVIEKLGAIQLKGDELTILNTENSYDFQNANNIEDISSSITKLKSIKLSNKKCKTIRELKNIGVNIDDSEYKRQDDEECCANREIIKVVIDLPNNPKATNLINNKIEKNILMLLNDSKHKTLSDYVKDISNTNILYYDDVRVNTIVKTNNKNVFSVELFYWSTSYMAGTIQDHKWYSYSKYSGLEIKLSDIIKKDKQLDFYNLVKSKNINDDILIQPLVKFFNETGNYEILSDGINFYGGGKFPTNIFIPFTEFDNFINYTSDVFSKTK